MQNFTKNFRFLAVLCDEADVDLSGSGPKWELRLRYRATTPDDIALWLDSGETKAAILIGSVTLRRGNHFVEFQADGTPLVYDNPIIVAHTGDPDWFYAANYPPQSPDDVIIEGEDLPETLRAATIEYYE